MATFDPSAVFAQVIQGYIKLPLTQKILFPVLFAASISGLIYVSKWATQPDYAVLFSDLEQADSAAVVEKLKEKKINYQIRADGRAIAISPPEMVHELRIELAGEGVPKGGHIGYELFDTTTLATTTFVERLKLIRAIQGELERTIAALDAVKSSRVHITIPEKTVFARQAVKPTASVMLRLKAGAVLDKKQIKGITNLVAGSVEGLLPENVSIVDIFGNLLTSKDEDAEKLGLETTRVQYQREIEQGYVQRVEQILTKILGPDKAIARVTAELDFTSLDREEESYDPSGQVLRSERSVEEGAGSSQRGGVPGVVSNLSNDPNLIKPKSGEGDQSNHKEAVKNYEVSRAVSKTNSPRGKLVKISAAVLVDGTYEEIAGQGPAAGAAATAPAEGEKKAVAKVFKPLDNDMLVQIESLVKAAVGFDGNRGDTVTVQNIPFHVPEHSFLDEMEKKSNRDWIIRIVSTAGPVVFVIFFFLVVVRPMVRFLITPTDAEVDLSRLLPKGMEELEKEMEQERAKAQVPTFQPAVDMEQLGELMAENSRIVKENPQQAALLIRYWLNDGRL